MNNIMRMVLSKSWIMIMTVAMFLYALINIDFNFTYDAKMFLLNYSERFTFFLCHVMIVLIFIIKTFTRFDNEMIVIRYESSLELYRAELLIAGLISGIYVLINTFIQIVFLILLHGSIDFSFVINFAGIIGIQLLTVFFTVCLYIMLTKFSRSKVYPIIIIIAVLAFDALTTILAAPFLPRNLNIFIGPMCALRNYLSSPEYFNFVYLFSFSIVKIVAVILISFFKLRISKRDVYA